MNIGYENYKPSAAGMVLLPADVRAAIVKDQAARKERDAGDWARRCADPVPKDKEPYEHLLDELKIAGAVFSADGLDHRAGKESFFLELAPMLAADGNSEISEIVSAHFPAKSSLEALTQLAVAMRIDKEQFVRETLAPFKVQAEAEELLSTGRALKIFDAERLSSREVTERVKTANSDWRKQTTNAHANAMRYGGYRLLPDLTEPLKALTATDDSYANFEQVIGDLGDSLTLCHHQRPEGFRVRPILMNGAPGIGKTAFGNHVGRLLGVPFEKMSAAGLQNGFVLCGSAKHWGNSAPGLVFNMLSESKYATGILLIDEVDKMPKDERYNALPALLDLLEPESARQYKDESADIVFDASRLIILMTSNSVEAIDPALLSRCKVAEIGKPQFAQRLAIMRRVNDELNGKRKSGQELILDLEAAGQLAESELDLRALTQAVHKAYVAALRADSEMVRPKPEDNPPKGRPFGFI